MEALEHSLKEELSMAKALLMLSNVSLSMDLESSQEDVLVPNVVKLKGNPRLIQLLITLRQKARFCHLGKPHRIVSNTFRRTDLLA
eukprot:g12013.t1